MEERGVISPVDEAMAWCSGMVHIPKANGCIRICVDLTPLTESVKCEVRPMARIYQILAKICGSKVFSQLYANSGFW